MKYYCPLFIVKLSFSINIWKIINESDISKLFLWKCNFVLFNICFFLFILLPTTKHIFMLRDCLFSICLLSTSGPWVNIIIPKDFVVVLHHYSQKFTLCDPKCWNFLRNSRFVVVDWRVIFIGISWLVLKITISFYTLVLVLYTQRNTMLICFQIAEGLDGFSTPTLLAISPQEQLECR